MAETSRKIILSDSELAALIEKARRYVPTPAEEEECRRSFAYGNVALHNPSITREMVDKVADEMKAERGF